MPRTITYTVSTQYTSGANRGYYNPTYRWDRLDFYLQIWAEYFDIVFQRVNSGPQVQFIQANSQISTPGAWMWTRGKQTFISPVVNYGKNDWLCGMPTNHEMLHWNNVNHLPEGNVMAPNGGRNNFTQMDCQRYLPYAFKSARRPWNETAFMRNRYGNVAMVGRVEHEEYNARHESQHEEIRQSFGLNEKSVQADYTCADCQTLSWWQKLLPVKMRAI